MNSTQNKATLNDSNVPYDGIKNNNQLRHPHCRYLDWIGVGFGGNKWDCFHLKGIF